MPEAATMDASYDDSVIAIEPWRRRYLTAVLFMVPVLTFTFPGRPNQAGLSADPLTILKLFTLVSTLFSGVVLFALDRRSRKMARGVAILLPYFAFLGWAILSVLWTPLRSVTLNQAGGLTVLLIFVLHVSCAVRNSDDVSWMLKQLCYSSLFYSGVVLVAFLINPSFSGLDRSADRSSPEKL
ncbi:MAG: hypothetical protein AAFX06_26175, partial [Planctomycetota bacterium]